MRFLIFSDSHGRNYHIEKSEVKEDGEYLMQEESAFWVYIQKQQQPALILPSI